MKLILAGLSSRDEMGFDLFLKRHMASWRWRGLPPKRGERLPAADILVIDLAAHGWAQHTDVSERQLTQAAGGAVAVLLVSAHDTSWTSAQTDVRHEPWIWLGKPYNAELMRNALGLAAELSGAKHKAQLSASRADPETSGLVAKPTPGSVAPVAPPKVTPTLFHVGSAPEHGLDATALALRLANAPADRFVLLRKLSARLQGHLPFEVRFTVQHRLIIHPADGWVASNTPMPVVLRVCHSDALAGSVSMRDIGLAQVEERLHQLGMTPHDLGDFLLEIAAAVAPKPLSPS